MLTAEKEVFYMTLRLQKIFVSVLAALMLLMFVPKQPAYALSYGWNYFKGDWYFIDEHGKLCSHTWIIDGNKKYYVDKNCKMVDCYNHPYGCEVDRKTYYFGSDGSLQIYKWYKMESDDVTLWLYTNGQGQASTGWKKISGKWYYFDKEYGFMYDANFSGITIDGKKYFFDKSGAMMSNCWTKTKTTTGEYQWYYLNKNGNPCLRWKQIGKKWYYFDPELDGIMLDDTWFKENNDWYHFDKNGVMETKK